MINYIFYLLSCIYSDFEPFDVRHKTYNLYDKERNIAFVFDGIVSSLYKKDTRVIIIHTSDESPNINYLNYYTSEKYSLFENAKQLLDYLDYETTKYEFNLNEQPEELFICALDRENKRYLDAIVNKLEASDEYYFPQNCLGGLLLENWFRMQSPNYTIEYNYNNKKCLVVNDYFFGRFDWGKRLSAYSKLLAIKDGEKITGDEIWQGVPVGKWVYRQRNDMKNGTIREHRKKILESIDFCFDEYADCWMKGYSYLKQYKEEYGHCDVSRKEIYRGFKLGHWVANQRAKMRIKSRSKLTDEQIRKLNELGVDWGPVSSRWEYMYDLYIDYIKYNNGDTYIPKRKIYKGKNLGMWVHSRYKDFEAGNLSEYRIRKLKETNNPFFLS